MINHRNFWDGLSRISTFVLGLGAAIACILMIPLLGIGLFDILKGITGLMEIVNFRPELGRDVRAESLRLLISGVELLLLSPLGFLVLRAMAKYVRAAGDEENSTSVHKSVSNVKAFIIGLLFTVVAADLVSNVISKKTDDVYSVIKNILAVVVLGAFYSILIHKVK